MRYFGAIVLICAATSISTVPFAAQEEAELLPSNWGRITELRVDASECPQVSGKYFSENGERIVRIEHGTIDDRKVQVTARSLFRHPRATDPFATSGKLLEKPLPPNQLFVEILQPSADHFVLHKTTGDGRGIRFEEFDRSLGDFECKDGFIFIKPYLLDQTGLYVRYAGRFSRTDDGHLLYQETIENRRSEMLIFHTSSKVRYWYRFAPINIK